MSNGWDDEGSPRLFCALPPGETTFGPNVFCGRAVWPYTVALGQYGPAHPTVPIGVADMAIEFWVRPKWGSSPAVEVDWWTGLIDDMDGNPGVPMPLAGMRWAVLGPDSEVNVQAFFQDSTAGGLVGTPNVDGFLTNGIWNYVAVNFDRDGNMELFINNVSQGVDDISAETGNIGSPEVYALVGRSNAVASYEGSLASWPGFAAPSVVIGRFAIMNRLMTAAERADSFARRGVQNIAGVTLIYFDWKEFDNQDGWDGDLDHCVDGIRIGQPFPVAYPVGTDATIQVRDQSGNARHWTLPSADLYGTTTPAPFDYVDGIKFDMAFGTDASLP